MSGKNNLMLQLEVCVWGVGGVHRIMYYYYYIYIYVGRTTHFFGFFTGKQNVSETMPFGENSHSAKFQADISNSF